MYGMLFKYPDKPEKVFDLNPELRCWEEFLKLEYKEMCFVMLVADVASPYRVYRQEKRYFKEETGEYAMRRRACYHLGYTKPKQSGLSKKGRRLLHEDISNVEIAIALYRDIQHADDIEALYKAKERYVKILNDFGEKDKTDNTLLNNVNKIFQYKILSKVNSEIRKYEELIDNNVSLPEDKKVEKGEDPDKEPVKKSKDEFEPYNPDGI